MNVLNFLSASWQLNGTAITIAAILIFAHVRVSNFKFTKKSISFFSGVLLLLVATNSPLEGLGRDYLFSAHMLSHVILLLIVPPLLLTGTSSEFLEKIIAIPSVRRILSVLLHPGFTWFFGVGSMWILHIPYIFNTIHKSAFLNSVQVIFLLIFGILFIWPVFAPVNWKKIQSLTSTLYLFTACVGCTVLGILITFTPLSLYTSCLTGQNGALLSLIHLNWD